MSALAVLTSESTVMTALPAALSLLITSAIPGASASTTDTATPRTSLLLRASSRRRICPSGVPSLFRFISTSAPSFVPASFIPCSAADQ